MKRFYLGLVALLAGLGLALTGLSASVNTTSSSPVPIVQVQEQAAEASVLSPLVIKHSSLSDVSAVSVCKSYPTCGTTRSLLRGQNTKTAFGWSDADAFYLPAGYDANVSAGVGRKTATGWTKLYGCAGCTRTVDIFRQ